LDSELSPGTNQECYHSSLHPKASHNLDVLTACDLLSVTTLGDRSHTQQAAHNPSALQQSETRDNNKWDDFYNRHSYINITLFFTGIVSENGEGKD